MFKKLLFLTILLLLTMALSGCLKKTDQLNVNIAVNNQANSQVVGGDKDEHGCLGSAGYSWCAIKNKCLRIWEEVCDEQLNNELRCVFAEKKQVKISDVKIAVTETTADHVRGGVIIAPGGVGEGGNFFAAKIAGRWQVVFDGNGGIACQLLEQYDFPQSMQQDCYQQ